MLQLGLIGVFKNLKQDHLEKLERANDENETKKLNDEPIITGLKMKIMAICGSPRKGNTYTVLKTIKENFPGIDYRIFMLNNINFEMCKGCYSCVVRGEERCPLKDDRDMILSEIADSDGVIFASPTYSHMISAPMKNFFDRFGYLAHRPQFFDKYAMSVTTCSGYGSEFAIKYVDKMAKVFGFSTVPPLELQVRPGKISEKDQKTNTKKIVDAFKVLISTIEKGKRAKPSLNSLVPFHIFKLVSEIESDFMKADYKYYKDKTDFYYETKVNPLKTWLAKRIARKEILG